MLFAVFVHSALALTPAAPLSRSSDRPGGRQPTRHAVLRTAALAAAALGASAPALAIPPMQDVLAAVEAEQAKKPEQVPEVLYTPPSVKGESTPEALALAQHLKARGAKMYGAYWCSHCNNQKVAFGAGGTRVINYVECAKDGYKSERDFCQEKGIKGYPTWEIDGKFYPGERSLEDLMALSGFSSATASK